MKAIVYAAALVSAVAGVATAGEPLVVWRSSSSGVLAVPAPASVPPATPPVAPLAVTYGGNRVYWSTRESVLLMPDVSGGSGRYEYALATAMPLPAGLVFDSATGIFSGRVQIAGDFSWSILVRYVATGAMTTTVARIIVVT